MPTYRPFAVSLNWDSIAAAVHVPDISQIGSNLNPEMAAELVAQSAKPLHVAIKAIKPVVSFDSFAIATLLDALGVVGFGFTGATNPGIIAYWQKFSDVGEAVSGSYQRSHTVHTGCIVPKRLSVDHQGDAKLEVEVTAIKTSGNACIVLSDTAALPSIAVASARWTLGPCKLNNVALNEYTKLEIDFGNTVEVIGSASDPYATHIEVKKHEPKIKLSGIDIAWFGASNVPIGGIVAATSTDYVYLRKRSQDGSHFVGDGTAEHIKFSLAGLAAVGSQKGEAQRVSETELMLTLAVDGSGNNPLIVDTTSAIA
jgi:hypothetical protein